VVHVHAQRRGRRVAGEAARFARVLVQRVAETAEFLRQGELQIAGGLELVEILLAELVVAVVAGRPLPATLSVLKSCLPSLKAGAC